MACDLDRISARQAISYFVGIAHHVQSNFIWHSAGLEGDEGMAGQTLVAGQRIFDIAAVPERRPLGIQRVQLRAR